MANKNYIDPITGLPCTKAEYNAKCASAGITPTTTGGVPVGQTGKIWFEGKAIGEIPYAEWSAFEALSQAKKESYISEHFGVNVSGQMWSSSPATMLTQEQIAFMGTQHATTPAPTTPTTPTPTFGAGAAATIPTPEVKPAPAYEPSPEEQAWKEEYGATLTDWVKSGGYGIPEETQAQMIQLQTDTLKAREQENIRVMKNNMERRGITNSGYVQANMNMITSNTSVALAGAISDVQIKSALMKMASFEKAMGAAAQFLGYLSEQSQLAYAPEFATWGAEQLAKMNKWQGQLDLLKMDINQAYQTQNIQLQAQLQSQYAEQQHGYDIELAEMEIEANQQAAAAEGAGNLIGSASGLVTSLAKGS